MAGFLDSARFVLIAAVTAALGLAPALMPGSRRTPRLTTRNIDTKETRDA